MAMCCSAVAVAIVIMVVDQVVVVVIMMMTVIMIVVIVVEVPRRERIGELLPALRSHSVLVISLVSRHASNFADHSAASMPTPIMANSATVVSADAHRPARHTSRRQSPNTLHLADGARLRVEAGVARLDREAGDRDGRHRRSACARR